VGFFVGEGSAGVVPLVFNPLALAWRAVIAGEFIMSFKFVFWLWCEVVSALWLDTERRRGRLTRGA
jgi:hypothetical protein